MTEGLSQLEEKIYLYIIAYLQENTFQPSVREIAAHSGLRSTRAAAEVLQRLAEKGYIEREGARSRAVRLIGLSDIMKAVAVPCYARLAASRPALRDEDKVGLLSCDRRVIPTVETILVRASDAAAEGALGILPNDWIICDPASRASEGALVLARVNSDARVRTLVHRGAQSVLLPADQNVDETVLGPSSDFEIVGIVHGVIRTDAPLT